MKRAEQQPVGNLTLYAGIYLKTWSVAAACTVLPQHSHAHDHMTLVVSGAVHVACGDQALGVYHAPATIKIPAHTMHTFTTLTPGVVLACIHATELAEPEIAAEHHLNFED